MHLLNLELLMLHLLLVILIKVILIMEDEERIHIRKER